ncbi:MAG TPA: hypothetical protein VNM15_04995 [Candidatus Binatia bacterium]|jgi:aminocarboxymuconate-semialdehyde decarboxylase|nr:hypothetical protein [Candidatus Binatia bacterium]
MDDAGFYPFWGRLDHGYRIQDSSKSKISRPPSEYLKRMYFDTVTHNPMALEYRVENFGAGHVLLGSDYPCDMGDPEPVQSLRAARSDDERLRQVSGQRL